MRVADFVRDGDRQFLGSERGDQLRVTEHPRPRHADQRQRRRLGIDLKGRMVGAREATAGERFASRRASAGRRFATRRRRAPTPAAMAKQVTRAPAVSSTSNPSITSRGS